MWLSLIGISFHVWRRLVSMTESAAFCDVREAGIRVVADDRAPALPVADLPKPFQSSSDKRRPFVLRLVRDEPVVCRSAPMPPITSCDGMPFGGC
jgi:hypothetical protein